MTFFMTELAVNDLAISRRWYEGIGFRMEKLDESHGFALLRDVAGHRLALKRGTPVASSILLHLEVPSLPSGDVKTSDEGYERVIVHDPDGYRICCFRWRDADSGALREADSR